MDYDIEAEVDRLFEEAPDRFERLRDNPVTDGRWVAGLDPIAASEFDELVLYLRRALDLTIVMVTHDLDTLSRTCDRVAVLVDRKVIVDTLPRIQKNEQPWIREYFHGPRGQRVSAGGGRVGA